MSSQKDKSDEPPPPTRDPSTLILRIGDSLESHADEIDRVYKIYNASIVGIAFLTTIVTLFLIALWSSLNFVTRIIYVIFDVAMVAYVSYALWAQKGFGLVDDIQWEVDRFRFITNFELLPPQGSSPSERIWNSLKNASHISEELNNLRPDAIMFNAEVSGKSGKQYHLDVFVHQGSRSRLLRFLARWTLRETGTHRMYFYLFPRLHEKLHEAQTTILVKRLAKQTPVTRPDLETVKETFEDISEKLRDMPEHAVVVSTSGFSEDAIAYVKDEKNDITPFDDKEESSVLELIVERDNGSFEVAYYG